MKTKLSTKQIIRYEPILFWTLVIIGTLPLLLSKYYLTLDGAAHLYNGNIIKELILGNHQEFSNLFIFNPLIVPNSFSHILFALFGLVFPDYLTEKIVLIAYLVIASFFFRKICLHFRPENRILSYLMIPFAHNHLFYLGSYNLVWAIALFLVTVYYGLHIQKHFQIKQIITLSVLILLVYFSHVLIVMITMVVVLIVPITSLSIEKADGKFKVRKTDDYLKNIGRTIISIIPSLTLTLYYLVQVDSLEKASRSDLTPLLKGVIDIRPLMTLAYKDPWETFNNILFAFFIVLIISNIILVIKENTTKSTDGFSFSFPRPHFSWIWLVIAFFFFILYIIVPNANILPERLIFIVFLFLILGISILKYPKHLRIISFFFILSIQVIYVNMHIKEMKRLSHNVEQMKATTKFIEPGSLLLTLNYSNNWLDMHSAGYFGSGKPIAVLENYEGNLSWFPISWNLNGPYKLDPINIWDADNKKLIANFYINQPDTSIFSLQTKENKLAPIPYVVKFGNTIDLSKDYNIKAEEVLNSGYILTYQNDFCKLYRLK